MRTTRREFVAMAGAVALRPLAQTNRAETADPGFTKAMNALRSAIPRAQADPERPVIHFHPLVRAKGQRLGR